MTRRRLLRAAIALALVSPVLTWLAAFEIWWAYQGRKARR